jgi:transcriptional regulator with PAS, ATPase and Fis domain
VLGESGTGKELVARLLHAASGRQAGPFVARNCGAVPEQLFEAEFFGAERGAFTDARSRPGSFESAHGGTLFLDEIGELGLSSQAKFLRAMENGEIMRLGSNDRKKVDVRIIAATNRNLKSMLAEGRLREDLYYRLNVLRIEVPPLRERPEDISVLARHFLGRLAPEAPPKSMTPEALYALMRHAWPGNVRELRNVVERAHYSCAYEYIGPEYLSFD